MTKKLLTATAAVLFAAAVHADDAYHQFIEGNPDSDNERRAYQGATAVQPGVGADIDRYQGFGDDNPDLFDVELGSSPKSDIPNIYGPFGGSTDLTYGPFGGSSTLRY
jgi:hypothetical protein